LSDLAHRMMLALTIISAVAAIVAAYFAGRQLYIQRNRWAAEDSRTSPSIHIGLSAQYSKDGWYHGVWSVTNRAPFSIELLQIHAVRPTNLVIGDLDPLTDGPVLGMQVKAPGKTIEVSRVVPVKSLRSEPGLIGSNFLYRISSDPEKDRGRAVKLRFVFREVDNPTLGCVREQVALIPRQKV
jgi:hypothetical protein